MTNDYLARRYLCARCWGAIVEKFINGKWVVVCAADESHAGFVTRNFVESRRTMNRLEAAEVGSQYAEILHLQRPDLKAASRALYGNE
jgi:hypothetical protein